MIGRTSLCSFSDICVCMVWCGVELYGWIVDRMNEYGLYVGIREYVYVAYTFYNCLFIIDGCVTMSNKTIMTTILIQILLLVSL